MKCYPTGGSRVMVGRRIAALRVKAGMNQKGLAAALDISRSLVASWEVGQQWPTSKDIVWLSDYFKVSTDYILKGIVPEHTTLHAEVGLSDKAIDTLRQFKEGDVILGETENCAGRVAALNKALENRSFLENVASILTLDKAEAGYYDGCCHTPGEPFYECKLSPDSYAGYLSHHLTLVLNAIREGVEIRLYPPAIREQEAVIEELRAQGRLIEKGGSNDA